VIAPLMDKFGWSRVKATAIVCVVAFAIGIVYTTTGGLYWLDIVDRTVCFYGLLITGALACLVVGWGFGADKLRAHLNETSDIKVGSWWNWLLKIVVPLGLLFVVIYGGFMQDIPASYGGYPRWATNVMWIILGVTLLLSFVLQAIKTKGPKEGE
ncbi:MAG TPA: sodium-dependent transporter, partial [Dehalococcoidia bacterium]|nr:sodium-dependent transporter [Dehalococcoidia bacterium]